MVKNGVWNMTRDHGFATLRDTGINMEALRLNPDLFDGLVETLDPETLQHLFASWYFLGRKEQLPPSIGFRFWLYMAGRGAGKTRTGAEWTRGKIMSGCYRGGLIAPTAADARDVMVEGESGIIAVCQSWDRDYKGNLIGKPLYEPSKRRLTWENGAVVTTFSADEPERLRGPQHEFLWMDELGAWRRPETFDQAMFGLRLGRQPQTFISTTPRQTKLMRELVKKALDPDQPLYEITRGGSWLNKENLDPIFIQTLMEKYGGTQLGRQELAGELLDQLEGALWTLTDIDECRVDANKMREPGFYFERIVVSVDPATTSTENADEHGIVVAGLANDTHAYILEDATVRGTPDKWGKTVSDMFVKWDADLVVAEVNQGGEMVKHVIQSANPNIHVKMVHASKGKKARAEPVSQKYEQKKVHHVGTFGELEDQMVTWEFLESRDSPDRIDALVWAIWELLVKDKDMTGKAKPISGLI